MPDDEIPAILEDFRRRGYDVLQTGRIDEDIHYYLDTERDLGLVYEIGNGGSIGLAPRRYPDTEAAA